MEVDGVEELLFFETFSHDITEEINLDLVQFPKPVIISEIRIIPLGARVLADFPGGVRLGATNPSKFHVEFFVNDLSKHGASTFENLGDLEYQQTSEIQFKCDQKKIPTDGLVLRGWYTTITLAVYGGLSAGVPPTPPDPRTELSASAATAEWVQSQQAAMYMDPPFTYPPPDFPSAPSQHPYVEPWQAPVSVVPPPIGPGEVYDNAPKDYGTPPNWEPPPDEVKGWETGKDAKGSGSRSSNGDSGGKSRRPEYWDDRKSKRYRDIGDSRGRSKVPRDDSWEREKSPYSDSNFRRRPKSPSHSPKRPYTPTERFWSPDKRDYRSPGGRYGDERRPVSPAKIGDTCSRGGRSVTPSGALESPVGRPAGEGSIADEEQFEPILSDEDIVDESDSQYPDMDYDFPDDLEDVVKPFLPYNYSVSAMENTRDPSLTPCEALCGQTDEDAVFQLNETLLLPFEASEEWLTALEQLVHVLPRALANQPEEETKEKLSLWIEEGLDLEVALKYVTPGAKLRHLKAIIRLAETLCLCGMTADLCKKGLQERLLTLFHTHHMALSIRLIILQALDATLLDKQAIDIFVNNNWELKIGDMSKLGTTYQHLYRMLEEKEQVRVKLALNSILQKINTMELLEKLEDFVNDIVSERKVDEKEVTTALEAVQKIYCLTYMLAQPRRFLPVRSQFEVNIDTRPAYRFLYRYFRQHRLLESIAVLLTNRECGQPVLDASYNLLFALAEKLHGLEFLAASPVVTNNLLKALQTAEEFTDQGQSSCHLSIHLPFRLKVLEILDKLKNIENEQSVFDNLHELYCVTLTPPGKQQVSYIFSLEDNLSKLIAITQKYGKKPAIFGYVCDLIAFTLRYADSVGYLRIVHKQLMDFDPAEFHGIICDFHGWLRPAFGTPDEVAGLSDIISRHASAEPFAIVPGELITAVRLVRLVCVPPTGILEDCKCLQLEELKYKHATLQFYHLDGLSNLITIISKILEYYEQPFVNSGTFLGAEGYSLFSFLETSILLVRRMLTFLIEARCKEYKDLTHVTTLVELYILAQAVPANSEAHSSAQNICRQIVKTLLAYTLPLAQIENYAKSLWTLMLSEVIKTTMKAPYCLMSGFSLLSELLPVPLPVYARLPYSDSEADILRCERQRWSAHLHPLAGVLHDLIATLASSSLGPLLDVLRRVGGQLADLAAPTALVVARAVLDPLLATLTKSSGGWEVPVSSQAARLLQFLSCLVTNPPIKAAVLSLITPGANARTDEKLITLGDALAAILRSPGTSTPHSQAQEHVVFLMHSLLDNEVALIPQTSENANLASSVPARDLLTNMVGALLDHLSAPQHPLTTIVHVLKALLLFTDHDYGFHYLKRALSSQSDAVWNMVSRLKAELSRENADALNALHFTFTLLRELKLDTPTPLRSLTLTKGEVARLLRWGSLNADEPHPLTQIHENLKEWSATDESLGNLFVSADNAISSLSDADSEVLPSLLDEDPAVGPALPLMEQFALRPIFTTGEPELKTLSSAYWLCPFPWDDVDLDSEQVPCDLLEMSASLLPDLHLPHEVQRVCRLKASDVDDGKKPVTSKYQLTGMRTRRPFIAPMRGRGGRAPPQRGDLFRSRPPNTSRPPSLHVDDFVALETCGQQPTGPTGYNKVSVRNVKEVIGTRVRGRGRGFGAPPYPRRDSPRSGSRGRGAWNHDDLRAQSRFRPWPTEDMRRMHPFQR